MSSALPHLAPTPRAGSSLQPTAFLAPGHAGPALVSQAETPKDPTTTTIVDGDEIISGAAAPSSPPPDLLVLDPASFLSSLALDPSTAPLLDPSFAPAAAAGAELAAAPDESRPRAVAESLRKVAKGAEQVAAALVAARRRELAAPLAALGSADAALREAAAPAAALRAGLARARQGVAEPVEELRRQSEALSRAHGAMRLLRAARRRASSAAALRAAIAEAEESHSKNAALLDLPALARAVADARAALEEWPSSSSGSPEALLLASAPSLESDSPEFDASSSPPLLLPSLEASCDDGGPEGVEAAAEGARRLARAALSSALGGGGGGAGGNEKSEIGGEALAAAGDALLALHWLKDARAAVEAEVAAGAEAAAEPLKRAVADAEAAAARTGGGVRIRNSAAAAALHLDASSLWDAAAASFSSLARGASRARLLDEAAARRRDPATHERLAAGIFAKNGKEEGEAALARYWRLAPLAVARGLDAAVVASSPSSSNSGGGSPLVASYPRLAALFDSAMERAAAAAASAASSSTAAAAASASSSSSSTAASSASDPASFPSSASLPLTPALARAAAAAVLCPARDRWASEAARRAADAAAAAFGGCSSFAVPASASAPLPTSADVQRLVARLHDVLTDAGGSGGNNGSGNNSNNGGAFSAATAELPTLAASAAAAGVATAASRVLSMAGAAAAASSPNSVERGVALSASAAELHRSLAALLSPRGQQLQRKSSSSPSSSSFAPPPLLLPPPLAAALDALQAAAARAAAPAFAAAAGNGAAALEKMHFSEKGQKTGNGNGTNGNEVSSPSAWAVDLGNCLAHFRGATLARLGVAAGDGAGGKTGENEATAASSSSSSLPASAAAALAARLAARLALLCVRHAICYLLLSQQQPSSSTPQLQLAADLAHVEASLCESLGSPSLPGASVVKAGAEAAADALKNRSRKGKKGKGGAGEGGLYSQCDAGGALRATRKLLFVPTPQLFPSNSSSPSSSPSFLALLRSIPAPERALWLLSRCPSAVPRSGLGGEGGGKGEASLSLARWLDDPKSVLLSPSSPSPSSPSSSSSSSSLAGKIRAALREAGSAPELEEGWEELRAEIERALAELEAAAAAAAAAEQEREAREA